MAMILNNKSTTQTGANGASLLGSLVFTRVGELKVHKNDLENIFTNNGLSPAKYDVDIIRPSDAMRRATSKLKNMQITIDINGAKRVAYLDIAESNLGKEVLRYVGRKVVDDKGKKVCYDQISTMVFDRGLKTLSHSPVDYAYQLEYDYEALLNDTEVKFMEWTQYHTQDTVRNTINKVISSLNPTKIKVTGDDDSIAKFVPVKYNSELQALKSILNDLNPYHTNQSYTSGIQFIDLVDTDANKDLLIQSVQSDISGRVNSLISDLSTTLISKSTISTQTAISFVEKLNTMRAEADEYAKLLKTSMSVLGQQIAQAVLQVEDAKEEGTIDVV
jgi:hypothetical protein